MTITDIANLKGPQGKTGPQGPASAEGLLTNEAIAQNLTVPGEARDALSESTVMRRPPVAFDSGLSATPLHIPLPTTAAHNAFPSVVRLTDGTYLAAWRAGTTHVSTDGVINLARSEDGVGWAAPVAMSLSEVAGAGDLRDPQLAMIGTTLYLTVYAAGTLRSYLKRSTDGGLTWSSAVLLDFGMTYMQFVAGPVVRTAAGVLLIAAYGNNYGDTDTAMRVVRSTDGGVTWGVPITFATGKYSEPNLMPTSGTLMFALIRVEGGGKFRIVRSGDDGVTWTAPEDAFWGHGNPHMVRLRSGAIVATYKSIEGKSRKTYGYAAARVSRDNGATWSKEFKFGATEWDMTYAAAVETGRDDELLCVWSAEDSDSKARMLALFITDGGAVTATGTAPAPVSPRTGIASQFLMLTKSTNQVVPATAWTAVQWETEREDHWEGFRYDESPSVFRVNETGLYAVYFRVSWTAPVRFMMAIDPPGGFSSLHMTYGVTEGTRDGFVSGVVPLTADIGYEARVYLYTPGGGTLESGNNEYRPQLKVMKLKG
jgi:hypothetical protein